jgi:hypothetical protein
MNNGLALLAIETISMFIAGISFFFNKYLSVFFFFMGIFCLYEIHKNTPQILYGPQGSSPPKNTPKGSIYLNYKQN